MTSKLQDVARRESSVKLTENGALAYNSTNAELVNCLNFFGTAGAMRPRGEHEIVTKFAKAYNESPLVATKMLFHTGNIRGGLGERRTFRCCLRWLAVHHPSTVSKNLEFIPYFNRWDSLFSLVGTRMENEMWDFIRGQLIIDTNNMVKNESVSLLAKWMPSENTSSEETRRLARKAISALKITPRQYRKMITRLRKYIDVTEVKMSGRKWEDIAYEAVPSRAMMNYSNAFRTHDGGRFDSYIENVKQGTAKINASALYPYDIVDGFLHNRLGDGAKEVAEEQWKALTNYVEKESNILVMADVSGSMAGRPMATSIGLAIYFAERNKGKLENVYMTFTNNPHFHYIKNHLTLEEKVNEVLCTDVGFSTNLEAAFDYLLEEAVWNGFTNEDMPSAICVISDMEIDRYMKPGRHWDFVKTQKVKYQKLGFKFPKIIMWNVESRQDTFLSQSEDVIFVSGQSPSVFKQLVGNLNGVSGQDLMLTTLNDEIYDCITV